MQSTVTRLFGSSLLAAGVAIASSVLAPTSAEAFTISFGANSTSSNNPATGASADVDFNFSQSGSDVLLSLDILNTTGQTTFGDGATQATLVGLGFDLIDDITSYTYDAMSSPFTKLYGDSALTAQSVEGSATLQPFGTFDVGIRSAGPGNFTGGNPTQGLTAGQSTVVSFLVSGMNLIASDVETAFFNGFTSGTLEIATRFQQVNAGEGSDKLLGGDISNGGGDNGGGDNGDDDNGDNGGGDNGGGDNGGGDNGGGDNGGGDNGGGDDTVSVPEPTTTAGIGLIAGAMTLYRRRKSS
jgi:hypothetical protein